MPIGGRKKQREFEVPVWVEAGKFLS